MVEGELTHLLVLIVVVFFFAASPKITKVVEMAVEEKRKVEAGNYIEEDIDQEQENAAATITEDDRRPKNAPNGTSAQTEAVSPMRSKVTAVPNKVRRVVGTRLRDDCLASNTHRYRSPEVALPQDLRPTTTRCRSSLPALIGRNPSPPLSKSRPMTPLFTC